MPQKQNPIVNIYPFVNQQIPTNHHQMGQLHNNLPNFVHTKIPLLHYTYTPTPTLKQKKSKYNNFLIHSFNNILIPYLHLGVVRIQKKNQRMGLGEAAREIDTYTCIIYIYIYIYICNESERKGEREWRGRECTSGTSP